jgi:broad-specificity NMP kinase
VELDCQSENVETEFIGVLLDESFETAGSLVQ